MQSAIIEKLADANQGRLDGESFLSIVSVPFVKKLAVSNVA